MGIKMADGVVLGWRKSGTITAKNEEYNSLCKKEFTRARGGGISLHEGTLPHSAIAETSLDTKFCN